jgi:hypothetical protein
MRNKGIIKHPFVFRTEILVHCPLRDKVKPNEAKFKRRPPFNFKELPDFLLWQRDTELYVLLDRDIACYVQKGEFANRLIPCNHTL